MKLFLSALEEQAIPHEESGTELSLVQVRGGHLPGRHCLVTHPRHLSFPKDTGSQPLAAQGNFLGAQALPPGTLI